MRSLLLSMSLLMKHIALLELYTLLRRQCCRIKASASKLLQLSKIYLESPCICMLRLECLRTERNKGLRHLHPRS